MYYIKRKICLEDARTRTQGLMSYYEVNSDTHSTTLKPADGENGNWGQFVGDPDFLSKREKSYSTMLYNYYSLLNMVRDGVKLRKVKPKNGEVIYTKDVGTFYLNGECFSGGTAPDYLYEYKAYPASGFKSNEIDSLREETRLVYRAKPGTVVDDDHIYIVLIDDYDRFVSLANYLDDTNYPKYRGDPAPSIGNDNTSKWAEYCRVVDDYIGRLNVPAWIFNEHIKTPKSMSYADVNGYLDWLVENASLSALCCNQKLWYDRGGWDMIGFLSGKTREYESRLAWLSGLTYRTPKLTVPISLTQNYTDVGVLTNVDGVRYNKDADRPHGKRALGNDQEGPCQELIIMSSITVSDVNSTIKVESLLNTLRSTKKYLDDFNNVLPGLFRMYDGRPQGMMLAWFKADDEAYYELTATTRQGSEGYWLKYNKLEETPEHYGSTKGYDTFNEWYGRFETQEEAEQRLEEEIENWNDMEPNDYIICVTGSGWELKVFDGNLPKDSINCDGYSTEEELSLLRYDGDYASGPRNKRFRTITVAEAGRVIAQTYEEEHGTVVPGTTFYFIAKYDNSPTHPMLLPYKTGNTANVYAVPGTLNRFRGDFIPNGFAPRRDGDKMTFRYVVGGHFTTGPGGQFLSWDGDGDVYYEEYPYDPYHVDYYPLDGVNNVPIYSEYVDFEAAAEEFYSPRLNLTRTGNTATIIRVDKTADVWTSGFSYDAFLTKEDYLINFSLLPEVDVNVTVDRGGVSAFERHYKLSECNTMQDLENYANGWFFEE